LFYVLDPGFYEKIKSHKKTRKERDILTTKKIDI
jgi:hypothetical protein